MKITRRQLRRLILKETSTLLNENKVPSPGQGGLILKGNGPHTVKMPLAFGRIGISGKKGKQIKVHIEGVGKLTPANVVRLSKEKLLPILIKTKGHLTITLSGDSEYKIFTTQ